MSTDTQGSVCNHTCDGCKSTFRASAHNLTRQDLGRKLCVACARTFRRDRSRIEAFTAKVWTKFKQTLDVLSYTDNNSNATIRCSCGNIYKATPTSIIRKSKKAAINCGKCQIGNKPRVKIGKRALRLLDIEVQAINHMIATGAKAELFKDAKDELVVRHGKRTMMYRPSFRYGKTNVAVFDKRALTSDWAMCAAIGKKCAALGKHRALVIDKRAITLPKNWYTCKAEVLKLLDNKVSVDSVTILALDPGTANHGWAVLRASKPFKIEVLSTGLVSNTITQMKGNMAEQAIAYTSEMQAISEQWGCDRLAIERYMTRGIKGTTIECVNAMIGCLLGLSWPEQGDAVADKMVMPASQWKNEWNRYSDLEAFYRKVNCVPHQVDAVGIGIYAASVWLEQKPFETIKKIERKLATNINKANIEPVKR